MITPSKRPGLTLIELLITLSIIAIIAGAVFVAVNPQKRLEYARNSRRLSDLAVMVDALKSFQSTHDGTVTTAADEDPASTPLIDNDFATVQIIGKDILTAHGDPYADCAAYAAALPCSDADVAATNCGVNWLSTIPAEEDKNLPVPALRTYLAKVPADPQRKGADGRNDSRYYVNYDESSGIVVVGSCDGADPSSEEGIPLPLSITQ